MRDRLAAWSLALEGPIEPASVAFVARVRRPSGAPAILKVNAPDGESDHEGDALRWWGPDAAVTVLDDDAATGSLLLGCCVPGDQLWGLPEDDAIAIAASILRLLHRREAPEAGSFRRLSTEAAGWADKLARRWQEHGRPFERVLLDRAISSVEELELSPGLDVVLHQDLHGGNILRRSRGDGPAGWVAIDPKPLIGDPAFDVASLLRDRRWELETDPNAARRVRRRLDALHELLGHDRIRMREWGIVHALAWGMDDRDILEMHVQCARWLAGS